MSPHRHSTRYQPTPNTQTRTHLDLAQAVPPHPPRYYHTSIVGPESDRVMCWYDSDDGDVVAMMVKWYNSVSINIYIIIYAFSNILVRVMGR